MDPLSERYTEHDNQVKIEKLEHVAKESGPPVDESFGDHDDATKRYEEAIELEYAKREGGA